MPDTPGESWIKLLYSYGPVPGSKAQEAEHVERVSKRLKVPPLSFTHPKEKELQNFFCTNKRKKVAIITGTAGDGKTTICLELIKQLSGKQAQPEKSGGIEQFNCTHQYGGEQVTVLYDVTGWRKKDAQTGYLTSECVAVLEKAARYATGKEGEPMLMAVNDGQLHEVNRALPPECSQTLKDFFSEMLIMHSTGKCESLNYQDAILVNLSSVPSDELMQHCLECILDRPEWKCLIDEKNDDISKLFGPSCPIYGNYHILKNSVVQDRLKQIAILADASGYHLPVRSIILIIVNSLLGHADFKNGLIKPGVEVGRRYGVGSVYRAAFHLNFFGLNLSKQSRFRKTYYQFLSKLRIGLETINDIDELLIFGDRQPKLKDDYKKIVGDDSYKHQDPAFLDNVRKYLLGEIESDDDIAVFRKQLAHERKRLFFGSAKQYGYDFWLTSVLHHAQCYIDGYLKPARKGEVIDPDNIETLANGLNRVWTGLLIRSDMHELYLTTGLDLTTAPISDVLVCEIQVEGGSGDCIQIKCGGKDQRLQLWIYAVNNNHFVFDLTILRFEFLMRVAHGAMPTSFSKEIYSDFLALKQKAIKQLNITPNPKKLQLVDLDDDGGIKKSQIRLN